MEICLANDLVERLEAVGVLVQLTLLSKHLDLLLVNELLDLLIVGEVGILIFDDRELQPMIIFLYFLVQLRLLGNTKFLFHLELFPGVIFCLEKIVNFYALLLDVIIDLPQITE